MIGDTTLGAVKVDANPLDIQAEGKLNLLTQATPSSRSRNESDGDAMFVNASTKGDIEETTNYNQFNVASVHLQANGGINANVAKGTDLAKLAQQPGMAWVNQLISNPALVNSTNWKTVEEAHKKWQTDQSGRGAGELGDRDAGGGGCGRGSGDGMLQHRARAVVVVVLPVEAVNERLHHLEGSALLVRPGLARYGI